MFADNSDEITPEQFRDLLFIIYKIAMDHYAEGPQSCRQTFKTIQAVVDSAVSLYYRNLYCLFSNKLFYI